MSDTAIGGLDLRRIHGMVKKLARLAEHSSLTGSLERGAPMAVQQYNLVLAQLERTGRIPLALFPALSPETGYDELGVAAQLLSGFLETDVEEEQEERARAQAQGGPSIHMHAGHPEEMKGIGEIIREHLPDLLNKQAEENRKFAEENRRSAEENRRFAEDLKRQLDREFEKRREQESEPR